MDAAPGVIIFKSLSGCLKLDWNFIILPLGRRFGVNPSDNNRVKLIDNNKNEKGGLSGLPIQKLSTKLIKLFYKEIKNKIPIIGVGGVDSGNSAFEKITAGASAIQLYTGMVYKGPGVVREIKKELIANLKKEKIKNLGEAVGINA